MAIVQISQIKHRHGLEENLPQLATAELGWSVDTQKLYIGNGTLAEGAPEVGNTEILTIHSPLPNWTVSSLGLTPGQSGNLANAVMTTTEPALYVQYAVKRADESRVGWAKFASNLANIADVSFDEEYTETSNVGLTLGVTPVGDGGGGYSYVLVNASLSADGSIGAYSANIRYVVSYLPF